MHGSSDIIIHVKGRTETKFSLMVSRMIFVRSLKDLEHWILRLVPFFCSSRVKIIPRNFF